MINFYPLAAFQCDFPDDSIEDEHDIVQFAGQNVSTAIAELLQTAGFKVTTPEHRHEHGWDFTVEHGKAVVWLQVCLLDPVYILQHGDASRFRSLTLNRPAQAEVLNALNDALRKDHRFGEVLWVEEVGDPFGYTHPVIETPGNEKRAAPEDWG